MLSLPDQLRLTAFSLALEGWSAREASPLYEAAAWLGDSPTPRVRRGVLPGSGASLLGRAGLVFSLMAGLPPTARVLKVSYLGGTHVGFGIRGALNAALNDGRMLPLSPADDKKITDRIFALHTKRAYLPILVRRVLQGSERAREVAQARDPSLDMYALDIGRIEGFTLVADIESLLTALHSTLELATGLVKVVERALKLPKKKRITEEKLTALPGISSEEQELFRAARGGFVHTDSGWLAVIIDGPQTDVAILTDREPDYAAGKGYVRLSRVGAVVQALVQHIDDLEALLSEEVSLLDKAL